MARKPAITVSDDAISRFLDDLARPFVLHRNLDAAYQGMAQDEWRESEALEWSESLIGDVQDDPQRGAEDLRHARDQQVLWIADHDVPQ